MLEEWEELWISDRVQEAAPTDWSYPWTLDPTSEDQIMQVRRSLSPSTGLGWDNFHMRLIRFLDGMLVLRSQEILTSWERNPQRRRIRVTTNVLLPKPDDESRPIGLLCFWARIWRRCRRRYVKSWEDS
eukprot:9189454-Pyramimonas_sp.AAC.1